SKHVEVGTRMAFMAVPLARTADELVLTSSTTRSPGPGAGHPAAVVGQAQLVARGVEVLLERGGAGPGPLAGRGDVLRYPDRLALLDEGLQADPLGVGGRVVRIEAFGVLEAFLVERRVEVVHQVRDLGDVA